MSPNGRTKAGIGTRRAGWHVTDLDGLLMFVDQTTPDACWLWRGPVNRDGYGRMHYHGSRWLAHRLSYLLVTNIDPGRLCVLHRCDTPACINPRHLFLGTQSDNNADMKAKQRHASGPRHHWFRHKLRGSNSPSAKLTDDDVAEIRRLYSDRSQTTRSIGDRFQIAESTVTQIATGKKWSHLPGTCQHRRPRIPSCDGSGVLPARKENQ